MLTAVLFDTLSANGASTLGNVGARSYVRKRIKFKGGCTVENAAAYVRWAYLNKTDLHAAIMRNGKVLLQLIGSYD